MGYTLYGYRHFATDVLWTYELKQFPKGVVTMVNSQYDTGPIVGLRPANERRRYFVTTSLIGWAQAQNQPCEPSIPFKITLDHYRKILIRYRK